MREGVGAAARTLPHFYPPDTYRAYWQLDGEAKWLWLAAQQTPRSSDSHASFPPAVRAAARELLLVAARQRRVDGRAASLGSLPEPLLHSILARAAYPLSAWHVEMELSEELADWDGETGEEMWE